MSTIRLFMDTLQKRVHIMDISDTWPGQEQRSFFFLSDALNMLIFVVLVRLVQEK